MNIKKAPLYGAFLAIAWKLRDPMKMFVKILLILLGGGLILDTVVLAFISNFNLGKILSFGMGFILLMYGIFFQQINSFSSHGVLLWMRYFVYFCFSFMAVIIGFIAIYGQNDNVTYKEDAVIVLGAGLRGDRVSLTLAQRLDAAIDYYEKNPEAMIVVSGGQGAQELIP
ncbi:MAG: YdcF family protein, partial [Bacillota bacterium]|nr:YdcF family protein [Bacillota bacterium]